MTANKRRGLSQQPPQHQPINPASSSGAAPRQSRRIQTIQRLAESASAFSHVRVLSAHGLSPRLVSILSGPHEPGFHCIYQPFEPRLALKIFHPNPHAAKESNCARPQKTWLSIGLFLIGYFPLPANSALQICGQLHQNGNSAAEGSTAAANFISKFEKHLTSR
jgi:hypothetical protein